MTTGDKKNAGTSAKVYCMLYGGSKGKQSSGKIWLDSGVFQRSRTETFKVDVPTNLSPLSKVEIGHDNAGVGAGWFLDQVIVTLFNEPVLRSFKGYNDEAIGLVRPSLGYI